MKKPSKIWVFIGLVAIAAVAFWLLSGGKQEEKIEFVTVKVEKGNLQNSVTATGTIEPVTSVTVGTQVSGIVSKLYVDYNSEVKKGQVIAELDKTNLMSELNTAKANLSSVQSAFDYQQSNFNRYQTLFSKGLISANDFENARLSFQQAKEQVATAQEQVKRAQTNLGYATITSPIDGIVMSKSVEEGQTVASSFSTPTIFTIAQDLTRMQVEANVDEADIGQVEEGQQVTFTVDAYPDDVFTGTVKQKRLSPTVTNNVVTYAVIIDAPNPDEKLMPGMTASVSIIVNQQSGIVVPMECLYFKADATTLKILEKQGITFKSLYKNTEEELHALKDITTKTVWVKNGNSYEQRKVTTGLNDGAKCIITDGLKAGDAVVTNTKEMSFGEAKGSSGMRFGPPERKNR